MTTRRKPAETFVLWGFHPRYAGGVPIKLTTGSLQQLSAENTSRKAEGFTTAIYKQGTEPAGLRAHWALHAAAQRSTS